MNFELRVVIEIINYINYTYLVELNILDSFKFLNLNNF